MRAWLFFHTYPCWGELKRVRNTGVSFLPYSRAFIYIHIDRTGYIAPMAPLYPGAAVGFGNT